MSSSSKIRWAAASACCSVALTRLRRLIGSYIRNSVVTKSMNSPIVSRPLPICEAPYQIIAATAIPPSHSISGGRADTVLVTCMLVR